MSTRRRFLLTLPAAVALARLATPTARSEAQSGAQSDFQSAAHSAEQSLKSHLHKKPPAPPPPGFVYFGTDTRKGVSKGIYLSRFDSNKGHLSSPMLVAATQRPSYLAISTSINGHRRLYAASEGGDANSTLSSFLVDPATGAIHPLNKVSTGGNGPCYITLDAIGDTAFVANYMGSSVATYRVFANGALSEPVERIDFRNPKFGKRGPAAEQRDGPHPRSAHLSPDDRFLLVSDLASDTISVFPVEPGAHLGEPAMFSNNRPGCGPRRIAFHPNGRWVYSLNELDSTIDHLLWSTTSSPTDPRGLLVNTGQVVKTIAPSFPAAKNTAAEVAVSPDGNFLYASNRGEDSLVVFSIADDGKLTFVQRIACGGKTPRHFTLSSDSEWLLCGNQDSATVTVFRRDGASGRLGGPTQSLPLDSVLFTLFA